MTSSQLNALDEEAFVELFGPVFEESPWIARKAWSMRPHDDSLHKTLCKIVRESSPDEHLALIRAHPDLAGRLAETGALTEESTAEQKAAGLSEIDAATRATLNLRNQAYREKFDFPFIICARLNKVNTILNAFDQRLANSYDVEIENALTEIFKIAELRLSDILETP